MPSNTIYPRGTLLQERYRIIEAVGTGGYGVVYRAEDTRYNGYLVAVKSINLAGLSTSEVIEATEAFNREVLMLSRLMHFSLPAIHDHFTDAEHWYMVMDFIEGETLEDYIAQADAPQNGTRCLPLLEVLEIGMQLCTVLGYLHMQEPSIIFRDLKPANIMRTSDGHLYLIDFGIARQFKHGQAKDTIPLGSPGYAAPEQYGRTQTTPRADIYSLGALLHQLISGDDPSESPFHFAPLHAVDNPILATLDELLLQMVEKDERNRPASVTIVKRRLQQIQFSALPPRVVTPPRKTRKINVSRRVFVGTLATVLVVGTLVTTIPLSLTEQGASIHDTVPLDVPSAPDGSSEIQGTPSDTALYIYQKHQGSVTTVAWSPADGVVASGDAIGNVYVWKPSTGETLLSCPPQSFSGAGPDIRTVSWSSDGKRLASADISGTVSIWDIQTKANMYTYRNNTYLYAMVWSPDGKYIAMSNNADVLILEAGTGQQVADLQGFVNSVMTITWSPDSRYLATGGYLDNTLSIWDIATEQRVNEYIYDVDMLEGIDIAVWSPSNNLIVASNNSNNTQLMIWPARTHTHDPSLYYTGHSERVTAAAWSPTSAYIASTSLDKTVQIWDAATGGTAVTYTGHTAGVNTVSWSPNGTLIASGGDDMTVQVWKS